MSTSTIVTRDPDETIDINQLIDDVVPEPMRWKQTPNPVLGGRRPEEFISQPDEHLLRDLVRAVKHGFCS
jgi:hypothetical protein